MAEKNLYDVAYELESAMREHEDYTKLKELYDQVNQDEVAKKLFDNFRNMQMELQQKQMSGQQITEEEAQTAQQQVELVQQHEVISQLMQQEQRMSQVIQDINKIVTKPLEDLYGSPEEDVQQ
ncbi:MULTISPECIES: YlbF family regulator [Bacillales]|uniref:YlbF family regulator n=1 Tax=Bacillales TaxID=1385 RepID=UPI001884521C|nr:YlbF family regulator [Pseudalkalibacillus hwajinpoensis]MBF0706911.1 YlbF family regulator [Pseudalkalibacillus hwajinpoensis]WLR58453.1 YlbF family regulator [Pseudalkalibacillus hwajinpoensis]